MACVDTLNISSDINLTPSRKRKRQFEKLQQQIQEQNGRKTAAVNTSCFTNAGFSSTPKKVLGKRRIHLSSSKENARTYVPNIGLEVKSIADIVENKDKNKSSPKNPYEVMRKPAKKRKRQTENAACFENPALNLELPEKQFNPYEVVRDIVESTSSNCFVNPALNLKIQDAPAACNPFEIQRATPIQSESLHLKIHTEPALRNSFENTPELVKDSSICSSKPCNLRIGLPFMPTVGCRINFKDMSMSQLTPTELLAEKLVFSPVPKAKTSLGSIGEETTMDIGKELDLYQLELENSINEAKLRKGGIIANAVHPPDPNFQSRVIDFEKMFKLTQKLTGISEDAENDELVEETTEQTEHHIQINIYPNHAQEEENYIENNNPFDYDLMEGVEQEQNFPNTNKNPFECESIRDMPNNSTDKADRDVLDEMYGCSDNDLVDDDSFDLKTATPFVRAYTKATEPKFAVNKESLKSEDSKKSSENEEHFKKPMNVKNMIRNSIRKLMLPYQHSHEQEIQIKAEHEKHGLIKSIRQSLRRKPARNLLEEESESKECELSIMDSSERTLKLKSDIIQIDDLTNGNKHNLRSSIRKSTRDVRNQFMKSVFHKKHEEYDFN